MFAFLAEHRRELFVDSFIADLFCFRAGRPSLPADVVGSVLVLKELYDLSDPQTAEALKFDIRWKVACGRSLTQMSCDPSTLVYWRWRIAASQRPDRVCDAVAAVIAETGILRGRRKRRAAASPMKELLWYNGDQASPFSTPECWWAAPPTLGSGPRSSPEYANSLDSNAARQRQQEDADTSGTRSA